MTLHLIAACQCLRNQGQKYVKLKLPFIGEVLIHIFGQQSWCKIGNKAASPSYDTAMKLHCSVKKETR